MSGNRLMIKRIFLSMIIILILFNHSSNLCNFIYTAVAADIEVEEIDENGVNEDNAEDSSSKIEVEDEEEAENNSRIEVEENIDVVLLGYDTELTSQKLRNTCEVLLQDVEYIATNPDLVCPVSFGYVPDCGSVSIMLKNATGKYPTFIGKPEPTMINFVMKKYGYTKEETVVIGDRLYTDIKSAINANVDSICVLSGEATVDDIINGDIKPTYTINDIMEVYNIIKQRLSNGN